MAKKILIVDDERDLVETLSIRFTSSGYQVILAFDGEEGLELARKEKPDLIILDVMMPKLNGYQVCRFLKFDDEYKNIPIVMLTARGQEKDKDVSQQVGADFYVTKPFDGLQLLQKIKSILGE